MSEKVKKAILLITAIVLVIIVIVTIVTNKTKNGSKDTGAKVSVSQELLDKYEIDPNDEAYKGKKIYLENGDIVIEGENGSKTIISEKKEDSGLKETTESEKAKYSITDVKVNIEGTRTSVTGKVKNNTGKAHKVSVNAKFTSEGRTKGSSNALIESLKAGETKSFEIVIMGDMTGYEHEVEVEFTN